VRNRGIAGDLAGRNPNINSGISFYDRNMQTKAEDDISTCTNTNSSHQLRPCLRVETSSLANHPATDAHVEHIHTTTHIAASAGPNLSSHSVHFTRNSKTILPSSQEKITIQPSDTSHKHSLSALLSKYDPQCEQVPNFSTIAGHREIVEQLFVYSILRAMTQLHKHYMIIKATNPAYIDLQGPDRLDALRKDLSIYGMCAAGSI
jgi:hypothetical protein